MPAGLAMGVIGIHRYSPPSLTNDPRPAIVASGRLHYGLAVLPTRATNARKQGGSLSPTHPISADQGASSSAQATPENSEGSHNTSFSPADSLGLVIILLAGCPRHVAIVE